MLKEITAKKVTPAVRREAVAHLEQVFEVSQRRACEALGVDRTMVRYRSRRRDDGAIRERMRGLAAERRRFGYRRLHWLLGREGVVINHKKFQRLYREERLQVRRRGGRKRALGTRAPMTISQGATSAGRWTSCLMRSPLAGGSASSRWSMTSPVNVSPSSPTLRSRDAGCPRARLGDRETDTPGHDRQRQRHRVYQHGDPALVEGARRRVALHRPGQTAAEWVHRELHARLRDECLNETICTSLAQARSVLDACGMTTTITGPTRAWAT